MCCRHNNVLAYVNVVQSGENAEGPPKTTGVIYDVGCNLEKGIIRAGRMKFAVGAFHSYAHAYGCQLAYDPRKNKGWGKSDGKGSERVWWKLSPEVPANRYVTSLHRKVSLDLKTHHMNHICLENAVKWFMSKLNEYEKELEENMSVLNHLLEEEGRLPEYYADQWDQQRKAQLDLLGNTVLSDLTGQLERLIGLEEQCRIQKQRLEELREKRRRTRTEEENTELASLPASLVFLEVEINEVVADLGSQDFRDIPGAQGEELAFEFALLKLASTKPGLELSNCRGVGIAQA
ncbi:uncharacterized protein MELLADRAFT_95534 [Melampsora larici-populina 98AG31]|uniref:Uncharacterized protein n=1 Tax=Melampsora larici-populina (strain 98AG31 / pathotype 3-4-7) TaxID=747676 RepID=F4S9P0_MELLP|nr:uncharacterized protein MELLADRAFT_95534 [Melampsora larici-populina 98AG31]EGF98611.1 hypothetical protein MELLADRAFT_95534 [Melampsora larici-populina 98AG31]